MSKPETCIRCGSARLIPTARISDGRDVDVDIRVDRKPEAILFTGAEIEEAHASVCVDCGHVEVYVLETRRLQRAYRKSLERQGKR